MYYSINMDSVVELTELPESDTGAPLPTIVATEGLLLLAYHIAVNDPAWDGSYVNVVGHHTSGVIAIINFIHVHDHFLGAPNDEALAGHPLYARGVMPYRSYEVKRSSWISLKERRNRVHPNHQSTFYDDLRHFIMGFHDSTFECLAVGFKVQLIRGSMADAVATMIKQLD